MARKGRNIYKRKDGRWEGRIQDISNAGKKYISVYGHSYTEVKEKMDKLRPDAVGANDGKMTVARAVTVWLQDNRTNWKSSTYACYMQQANKYIIPQLGGVRCRELTNYHMVSFLRNNSALSKNYLKGICGTLQRALKYVNTVYNHAFPIPIVSGCFLQHKHSAGDEMPENQSLMVLERYLLDHIETDTCQGILLAMYTGIRIGELCALTWEDVDLKKGILTIRGTMQRIQYYEEGLHTQVSVSLPKSVSSMRKIPLPAFLLEHLQSCKTPKTGYIIKGKQKAYAEPRTVQYRFASILNKCGIEIFNFHKLRHVFASKCLQQGFDIKTLSELLGHSSVQTTMNIYVHSDDERKRFLMNDFIIHQDF